MSDPVTKLLPPGRMAPQDLAEYVKARAYKNSPLYGADFSRALKAEKYNQGEQWIQRAKSTSDAGYATQWREMTTDPSDPNALPLPVYNEGVGLLENEAARLGRPEYKPRVRPRGENPTITVRESALGAERALVSRLKDMPWDQQADLLYLHLPLYGGAWLKSYWDNSWLDTVRVPSKSLICPHHPKVAPPPSFSEFQAEPEALPVDPDGLSEALEGGAIEPEEPLEGGILASPDPLVAIPQTCDFACRDKPGEAPDDGCCPRCGAQLLPHMPTLEEAKGPLGEDVPKGDWFAKVLPGPYGVFPRDAGVGVDRTDVDEWVEVHMETVDWVAERYPDKVRNAKGEELIKGDSPASLMAQNPTLGAPNLLQSAQTAGVLKNHCLVYEHHRKPWLEWDDKAKKHLKNLGRSVVLVAQPGLNDVICLDSTLLVESLNQPGTYVPRVRLEFIPWEFKDGGRRSTVGQSLWDRLFDPQDGVNERKSQIRAVNQRGANPKYLQRRGANLESAAAESAVPYARILHDTDPTDNRPPLELINNTTIDPNAYTEVNDDRQSMERVSGNVEVEQGQVPTGVSAATAIAYLKTEAGEKRRPRILRIRQALVRAWEHGVQLMSAYYIEPRPYSYEDETGEERFSWIHGNVMASANPKVDIYPTPDFDVTDAKREQVRDLITLGVIQPNQTPQLNRKVVKAIYDEADFFVDDDLQEQQAQREWQLYKDQGRLPVIDPSLDDHNSHHQEHGRACFSALYRQKEDEGNWDGALAILQPQWDETQQAIALAIAQGQAGPVSLQAALKAQWLAALQAAGFEVTEALDFVLSWRSHYEAHGLTLLVRQIKSQPTVAAPAQGSAPTPISEGGAPTQVQPDPGAVGGQQ